MAKLNAQSETFLTNIERDSAAVEFAQEAHAPVRDYLESDSEFGEYVEGTFLYGSYRRHTAVGDIKDVDIVVLTNFDLSDEENTPREVLRKLKSALARYYDDPENPQYQRRSIRIDQPLPEEEETEMTLDIIPAAVVDSDDDPLRVPDRVVQEWIWSQPKGHLRHTTELNSDDWGKGRFVPLVKMMTWWWKYQCEVRQPDVERPQPKGFWVECLTGENFDPGQHEWADHFIAVLERISSKYTEADEVPELQDPGLEGETISTDMALEEFEVFMEAVNESLEVAVLARDASDELKSSELWREVFGEQFPLYDAKEAEETRARARAIALADCSHARELPWPEDLHKRYRVRLDAYVYLDKKRLGGINSNGRVLQSGLRIKFVAKTKARDDYQVFWFVVNTGKHAASEHGLRGDEYFEARLRSGTPSGDPLVTWEHTEYTGKHWIECFIVKNDCCVGRSGRFYVNIRNPKFP